MNRRRLIFLMHGGKIDACLAAAKRRKGSGYGQGQTKTDCMQIRDTRKRGLAMLARECRASAQAYMYHSVLAAAVVVRTSRHHAALNR